MQLLNVLRHLYTSTNIYIYKQNIYIYTVTVTVTVKQPQITETNIDRRLRGGALHKH